MQKFFRKSLSCLLSAAVLAGTAATLPISVGASDITYGDLNGDGSVNSSDALAVLKYSVGLEDLTVNDVKSADVNADGKINSSDALDILKRSVGLLDHFTAEEAAVDPEAVKASFKRALSGVREKLPAYVIKDTVFNEVTDVELSGVYAALIPSSKLKEMEESIKKDNGIDRKYTKIVKQKSSDSADKMIGELDLSDETKFKSVFYDETAEGIYVLTVSFKDEKNPAANSLIVKTTGMSDYETAQKTVKEADEVEGATSTVDSFNMWYKNCILVCEIDKETDEFKSIKWSMDIESESKVTTAGLTVWMKNSGNRSSSYESFGY